MSCVPSLLMITPPFPSRTMATSRDCASAPQDSPLSPLPGTATTSCREILPPTRHVNMPVEPACVPPNESCMMAPWCTGCSSDWPSPMKWVEADVSMYVAVPDAQHPLLDEKMYC